MRRIANGLVGATARALWGRVLVLMYHQIGSHRIDPWALRVTPEHFDEHLGVLRELTTPIGLAELLDGQWRERRRTAPAAVVTFDDGYADNLTEARPVLARHGVPATIFVTAGAVGEGRELWWDELAQIVLAARELPGRLDIDLGGTRLERRLTAAAAYRPGLEADWEGDVYGCAPDSRLGLYLDLWQEMQPLRHEVRRAALDELAAWAGHPVAVRESHRVMTADELEVVSAGDLVEIGAHTVTHPLLTALPDRAQRAEIGLGKTRLESLLGRPVRTFSYPFGAHDDRSVAGARDAGFTCACTTVERSTHRFDDPFRVGRFDVRDWSGERFEQELRSWLRR